MEIKIKICLEMKPQNVAEVIYFQTHGESNDYNLFRFPNKF